MELLAPLSLLLFWVRVNPTRQICISVTSTQTPITNNQEREGVCNDWCIFQRKQTIGFFFPRWRRCARDDEQDNLGLNYRPKHAEPSRITRQLNAHAAVSQRAALTSTDRNSQVMLIANSRRFNNDKAQFSQYFGVTVQFWGDVVISCGELLE